MTAFGFKTLNKTDWIIGSIVFFCLFLAYCALGNRLWAIPSHPFRYYDILFELDIPRVVNDIAEFSGDHYRTKVHPLYVLFVNPMGTLLNKSNLFGLFETKYAVAILLNSAFGAASVLLSYLLFRIMGGERLNALLLALIFAFSMSQLLLSVTPDTSSLATFSLLVTYMVFWISLYRGKVSLGVWILAGIFSLGVTTTNFVQTIICFGMAKFAQNKNSLNFWKWIYESGLYALTVLIATSTLALIQKDIYSSSSLFFLPSAYFEDLKYASLLVIREPLAVIGQLLQHFFVVNIIGALPRTIDIALDLPAVTFSYVRDYSIFGWVAILCWISLTISGIRRVNYKKYAWFFVGLIFCLVFNIFLHSIYGTEEKGKLELFLYTGNFTFLVIVISLQGYLYRTNQFARLGLVLFLVVMSINNINVIRKIISIYEGFEAPKLVDQRWEELEAILADYHGELETLHSEQGGIRKLPNVAFYLFGMGNRQKLIYKGGVLWDAWTGDEIQRWGVSEEFFIPSAYTVALRTNKGVSVFITEDEEGIWVEEGGDRVAIGKSNVSLPDFAGHPFASVLKVLHQEMLVNIVDGRPLPNLLVYKTPWYRDAAMVGMVFQKTGNLDLIKDWILGLREPYDRNNDGETEADNLGQVLYLISLVADESHPLVPKVLSELGQFEKGDYIEGRSDFSPHPIYQTKWAKYGLRSLGLEDPYEVPQIPDSYATLFWWDFKNQDLPGQIVLESLDWPYLTWAGAHYTGHKIGRISDQDYPLTWEGDASQANYPAMNRISPEYVRSKLSVPHIWHAAEAFLYLLELGK